MKNSILNKSLFAAAAIAVSVTGFSVGASAQNRITKSVEVSYGDLDLASAEGQQIFDGRIKGAVRKVCGSYGRMNLREMTDHGNCVKEASVSAKQAKVSLIAQAKAGKLKETAMVVSSK
ncbi:UrcA family protein [Parasphingorhabdus sp.]|uniref:UrcA family protein n=1 Tax=Parasphingorhabdus sp. TaxID=2709688 RepID=UPI002F92AD1B